MDFIERSLGQKKVMWFPVSNRFMVVELPAFEVMEQLSQGIELREIEALCSKTYALPPSDATRFVSEIALLYKQQNQPAPNRFVVDPQINLTDLPKPSSCRIYQIHDRNFSVSYGTPEAEQLLHPKFSHLEVEEPVTDPFLIHIFPFEKYLVLAAGGVIIGQWLPDDFHYLSGKFSMLLLNQIYGVKEEEWMAVFHASAIVDGQQAIQFLGESGSGKSTLCAILMACGFDLLADDLVAVKGEPGEIYPFPAALSVKQKALDHLLPMFPHLSMAKEYHFPALEKKVRYLTPSLYAERKGYPCKALVFVKYRKESGCRLTPLSADKAFQQLVPDSWVSPLPHQATRFIDWFIGQPCFELTYSDNGLMVETVKDLFQNELS